MIIIYFIGLVAPYYKAQRRRNCPTDEVIHTEKDCKAASILLELEYQSTFDDPNTPIGCQYGERTNSYFNAVSGLSSSNPKYGWGYGGVCTRKGMP